MAKIYISGPISGMANYNMEAFASAAAKLTEEGHEPIDPAALDAGDHGNTWEFFLKRDIALLVWCDAVHVIENWKNSRGATLECLIADMLKIPVYDHFNRSIISGHEILAAFLRRLFRV